jgi:hypothetical protein
MDLSPGPLAGRVPWAPHRARSVVALVLSMGLLVAGTTGGTVAQDGSASPVAGQPVTSPAIAGGPLYLQTFAVGHVEPGAEDLTVRLSRASGQTMYIGELPERRVGTVPSSDFLGLLEASLQVPPYAAVLGQRADGSQVLVVGQVLAGTQVDPQTFEYRLRLVPDEVDIDLVVDAERLPQVVDPLDLALTYILFTGVQGCPPPQTVC